MTVLESVETKLGNKIELIGEIGEGQVLIIGVVHGDEPQGKYLIDEYLTPPLPNPPPQVGRGHTSYAYFLKNKAIQLRKNQTDAEKVLWNYLRANRFFGLHFKRQQPIGEYIVDFVCFSKKLIIELDGGQHNEVQNVVKDAKRTKFLEERGYKVIRIWNDDVFNNIEGVFEYIQSSLPTRGGGLGRGGKLFIPCLNPDGMKQNTRRNANDVDINRNFPTKNWGQNLGDNATCDDETTSYYGGKAPASEIETKFVIDVIEKYKPSLIITLHAPYKVVNYDGPAQEVAEKISDIIKYPVEASIGYPTPGSFGTWAGVERNIPIITLELDEDCPVENLIEPIFKIFDMFE